MTQAIEGVALTNHTECECRPVNHHPRSYPHPTDKESFIKDILGSDQSEVVAVVSASDIRTEISSTTRATTSSPLPPVSEKSTQLVNLYDSSKKDSESNAYCRHMKCPAPFSARKVTSTPLRCECDCHSETDSSCHRVKKGLQRLSGHGATCVRRGNCHEPTCEYAASFDKMKGMCPRKGEDVDDIARQHSKKQYGYERD